MKTTVAASSPHHCCFGRRVARPHRFAATRRPLALPGRGHRPYRGGDYGHGYDRSLPNLENVTVEAVRTPMPRVAQGRRTLRRPAPVSRLREMLQKEKPDLVSIAPGTRCHKPWRWRPSKSAPASSWRNRLPDSGGRRFILAAAESAGEDRDRPQPALVLRVHPGEGCWIRVDRTRARGAHPRQTRPAVAART